MCLSFCCGIPRSEQEYPGIDIVKPDEKSESPLKKVTFREMLQKDYPPHVIQEINRKAQETFKK